MKNKKRLSSGEIYRKYGIVLIMFFLFIASAVINHNFLKFFRVIFLLNSLILFFCAVITGKYIANIHT